VASASRRILLAVGVLCVLVRVAHLLAAYRTPLFAAHRVWPGTDMFAYWTALGDRDGAVEAYRRALELHPAGGVLEALQARLAALRA
jgi:hypothetical protein